MSDPSSTAPARPAGAPDPSTDLEAALKALVPTLAPVLRGQLPAVPVAAGLVTSLAGQQRYLGFSGNLLEAVALRWIAELCGLPAEMEGVFSSGGSVANLLGLGAARQRAYERIGADPAKDGMAGLPRGRIYASHEVHHALLRATGVLGLGRTGLRLVPTDDAQRLDVPELRRAVEADLSAGLLPVAVVGIAGSTSTGAVDPLAEVAEVAAEYETWFHVDGAYGLFGVLDETRADAFSGVRTGRLRGRGHAQVAGPADGNRGHPTSATPQSSGARSPRSPVPPSRARSRTWPVPSTPRGTSSARRTRSGAWSSRPRPAGSRSGRRCTRSAARGCVLGSSPTTAARNQRVLRSLHAEGRHVPSGTVVDGHFAVRACFVNPRQTERDVHALVDAVLEHDRRTTAA